MDWRIQFLQYCALHPLLLNACFVLAFLGAGVASLVIEDKKHCDSSELPIWLTLTLVRLVLRLSLCCAIEAIAKNLLRCHGSTQVLLQRIVDLLDVFGMVWFMVGNIMVFEEMYCAGQLPGIFFTSMSNIALTYLMVIVPVFIKLSLSTCPPSSEEDRAVLHAWGHRLLAPFGQELQNGQATAQQSERWRQWLAAHGCVEFVYEPLDGLPTEQREQATECCICLSPFGQQKAAVTDLEGAVPSEESHIDTTLVCYPCSARHVFHASCLHAWLQVTFSRTGSEAGFTCPYCRQYPQPVG